MAHKVVWSPEALEDIQSVADYIARDSESCLHPLPGVGPCLLVQLIRNMVNISPPLAVGRSQ
jgi:hypothetical protein